MVLVEFVIPLPLSVREFQVAQLFVVVKASQENTGGGEGVEIIENRPYDNEDGSLGISEISGVEIPRNKGQYTLKRYYIASRVPSYVRAIVPTDSLVLVEEAWNAYPICKTVLTNGYMSKDRFFIAVDTVHAPDCGEQENAHNLSAERLASRRVVRLNVADASISPNDLDPTQYTSEKSGRGPFPKDSWVQSADPVMCAYKLVEARFSVWGLQGTVEANIIQFQQDLFLRTLRQAVCTMDEWFDLSMEDIRRIEEEARVALNEQRQEGSREDKSLQENITASNALQDSTSQAESKETINDSTDLKVTA